MSVGRARRDTARSIYLDALRALALARVVLYHVTDSWALTAFTALPLMFFIAGALYAASLERRPARRVVRDRFRRILVPYWAYAGAMVALWAGLGVLGEMTPARWVGLVLPVLSVEGVAGPGAGTLVHLTWFALWYIQMHLILSLIGGPLRRAQQHHPRRLWIGLLVVFALSAPGVAPGLAVGAFYTACWVIGYAHFDGKVETWIRPRWQWVCAVTGPVGAVLFFVFHERAIAVAAIGGVLLGVFWLTLALGLQPRIEPWLEGRRARSVTTWFGQRSMTIYLWHGAALWVVSEMALGGGIPVRLAATCALLVVAVLAFGWLEDVAARRPAQLWPRLPSSRHATPEGPVIDLTDQARIDLTDRSGSAAVRPPLPAPER